MGKSLYIAEKPSVAQEFAKALNQRFTRSDGYLESDESIVTWCVGHLVTMSYPEKYDEKYKKWSFDTLPFLPETFKYEIIGAVKKQFAIVKRLLNRDDLDTIYECTDSGREGEYIFRLVTMMAGTSPKARQKRVWIDSQTEEEINRGIREAKDVSAYNDLSDAAFLRAKEDYLMGINFSRALSLKYGSLVASYMNERYQAIAVGRVMTCVLGMVVRREWEIRKFRKTTFYRVLSDLNYRDRNFEGEWRVTKESNYFQSPKLYKENGFLKREDAEEMVNSLLQMEPRQMIVQKAEKKKTKKNPPLLYNLAEIQNDCSKMFKISPDQTLNIIQELYEKKLCTYPRTDARVLSTAIAKVIDRNLKGLTHYPGAGEFAGQVLQSGSWMKIGSTRYTDDKQITDHYAIIPTGQGFGNLGSLSETARKVYHLIVLRFLSIFYPPAEYTKVSLVSKIGKESFFSSFNILTEPGFLAVAESYKKKKSTGTGSDKEEAGAPDGAGSDPSNTDGAENPVPEGEAKQALLRTLSSLKKGSVLDIRGFRLKEGETSPPKRYTSGSMILAMENAGQLIEDDELREQIKSCGIGTSATRAEILKKLFKNQYLDLSKKTQVITPTMLGEMIYLTVYMSISALLNPELTASWEKGLNMVAEGNLSSADYMKKLESFVAEYTNGVRSSGNGTKLRSYLDLTKNWYQKNDPRHMYLKKAGSTYHSSKSAGSRSSRTGKAAKSTGK
ncbi:MAG: DNA topoisomerase [Eubacterium sp.]|nr:DNA topoisomerase [Eubacterium sp.]